MEQTVTSSAMSASLLARDIYCVCFTSRDSVDTLRGDLAQARERFFTQGRKTLRVNRRQVIHGFEGKLRGKLSRRSFFWRKEAVHVTGTGRLMLEESFDQPGGYVVVNRDFRNVIASRVFFNKALAWLKSEYYEPWDAHCARVIFKPTEQDGLVERFDWDAGKKRYRSTLLYPVAAIEGAGQSLLNARFGEPQLLVSTQEGLFCYCPQEEARQRQAALEDLKTGTLVLLPAWEVKEGALAGEEDAESPEISFPSLEEYARIQQPEEEAATPLTQAAAPAFPEEEEFTPQGELSSESNPAPQEEPSGEPAGKEAAPPAPEDKAPALSQEEPAPLPDGESQAILQAARRAAAARNTAALSYPAYRGELREGKPWGRGRTEQPSGATSYEGGFREGKREGFGTYYYKDGNLCYAGSWKNDKKEGLGVSFRDSDHALHIAQWKEGVPQEFVSLFDKDGNLRYGGRIENGKKQGPGVSYNTADGTVFVGKWKDGQPTGIGSAFDKEGNLVYYGAWKDGKRHGHGTEFDAAGAIVFDGEWREGKYYNGILYQKRDRDSLPGGQNPAGEELPTWDL